MPGPIAFPLPGAAARQLRLGGMVCEDMWTEDVAEALEESGAEILIVPNGSPFEHDKQDVRLNLAVARVTETGLPLIYCNQVGGQDELVFDGASFVLNADRRLAAQARAFEEAAADHPLAARRGRGLDLHRGRDRAAGRPASRRSTARCAWACATTSTRTAFRAWCSGSPAASIRRSRRRSRSTRSGPSGCMRVMMPSRYTSAASTEDAEAVARGARHPPRQHRRSSRRSRRSRPCSSRCSPAAPPDITEENIQARIRGVILMALSNKFGAMVLTTGNKSEMSVGYATLYGDMCGGYSVLKDVYKTMVFALARWRNQQLPADARGPAGRVIPERVITKPPSAELRPDQTDQDSLPPYDELDAILQGLVEQDLSARELVAHGHDPAVVRKVSNLLDLAEYKRRQAPPGRQDHPQGLRPRPPLPDHQRVPQARPRPGAEG